MQTSPPGEPQFQVKYVGSVETWVGSARGCTSTLVQKIWDKSEEEKKMKRFSMLVIPTGIVLREVDNKKHEMKFDIKCISHYSAEKGVHNKVFAWIYQDLETQRLFCHAVLCTQREKAQQVAIVLSRSLQIAYKDWKGEKIRNARKISGNLAARQKGLEDSGEDVNYNFHFAPPSSQVAPAGGGHISTCAQSTGNSQNHSNTTSRSSSVKSSTSSQNSKNKDNTVENLDIQGQGESKGPNSRSNDEPIRNVVDELSLVEDGDGFNGEDEKRSDSNKTSSISSTEPDTRLQTTVLACV